MSNKPIGNLIDSLYDLRAERLALEHEAKELKAREKEMSTAIIAQLQDIQLASGRGSVATATITHTTQPNVTDWDAVYQFIEANQMFELLHRRVTAALWKALVEDGREVPGIEAVVITDLSLTKAARS